MPAIQKFGLAFLWTGEWNPPAERFGALIPIYGTLMTSAVALGDCSACEFWYCPVSDRAGARLDASPRWVSPSSCSPVCPSIVYGMWGLVGFRTVVC